MNELTSIIIAIIIIIIIINNTAVEICSFTTTQCILPRNYCIALSSVWQVSGQKAQLSHRNSIMSLPITSRNKKPMDCEAQHGLHANWGECPE